MKPTTLAGSRLAVLALALGPAYAVAQQLVLHCDPAQSRANFTLSASFHSVEGTFKLRHGEIRFDPTSGKIGGEIVFDAASGQTGNNSRDKKMHRDVLQSERYPEISFRPDRVIGQVSVTQTAPGQASGDQVNAQASAVQVHGLFTIHGSQHEITVPVDVRLESTRWTAVAHFRVPYVEWGLKNPINLFLHVGDSVDVVLYTAGDATPISP